MNLGQKIAERLEALNITPAHVAVRMTDGGWPTTEIAVTSWIRETRAPRLDAIPALAAALEIPDAEIITLWRETPEPAEVAQ